MNKKELYWKPGNILVTRGDSRPEYYLVKDDGMAYPCNRKLDDWWRKVQPGEYDDNLMSILPDCIRMYWDITDVYVHIESSILNMSYWKSGNIGETRNGLFYSFNDNDTATELNDNSGSSFLEKDTYNDDLTCNPKNRKSWDFVRVYKKI